MSALERVTPSNADETLAYLARRPFENVYVTWLWSSGQIERGAGTLAAFRNETGAVDGACFIGAQIVPCAGDPPEPAAIAAFATFARTRAARMIVGPERAVAALWATLRAGAGAARMERPHQPLYALTRTALRGGRHGADVARATRADLEELAVHSARMIAGETGLDPRASHGDFLGRTRRLIDAGWCWRYRVLGKLAFTCNVGAESAQTAQIQGVWSPPDMRGKGYATAALAAICDHLLDRYPALCLYVNDFNASAIALYERIGFTRAGEFSTIFL